MVKTKQIKNKKKWNSPWDLSSIGVLIIGVFLILIAGFSKPSVDILSHHVVITQGIVLPAIVFGSILWALIEFFTPPARGPLSVLITVLPAFIIGGLVGGFLGYYYHFGQYVLEPAFNGNVTALAFLVILLVASISIMANAAWGHSHGFRGQKGKKLNMAESATSKAKRGIFMLLVIFIAMVIVAPASVAIGNAFVAGHDNSNVLISQSQPTYINSKDGAVPYSSVNGTTTFDFPSNSTHTVYISTSLSLAALNDYAANGIDIISSGHFNVTFGTGTMKNFNAFASSSGNGTVKVPLKTYELTGNQTAPVIMKVTGNGTAMSFQIVPHGNNGLVTVFGPYIALQVGYWISIIILAFGAFFELDMYDMDLHLFDAVNPRKYVKARGGRK